MGTQWIILGDTEQNDKDTYKIIENIVLNKMSDTYEKKTQEKLLKYIKATG